MIICLSGGNLSTYALRASYCIWCWLCLPWSIRCVHYHNRLFWAKDRAPVNLSLFPKYFC